MAGVVDWAAGKMDLDAGTVGEAKTNAVAAIEYQVPHHANWDTRDISRAQITRRHPTVGNTLAELDDHP